jgi:lipid II:glycine glycyltransferase (peptidoglycan interpeptide bridge formation enzyme)
MFDVIVGNQQKKWDEIVRSMEDYDFYHLAEYHLLDTSGTPLLLYYSDDTTSIALPVILRTIEGSSYQDVTSVYGYAGPLTNRKTVNEKSTDGFRKKLLNFFDSQKIVSVFSRLHPLLPNQSQILDGIGDLIAENLTVAIDLTLPEEMQIKQYARSLKYQLNRIKKGGVSIIRASCNQEIDSFIAIYEETMKRVNASERYFFPRDYFYRLLETIDSALYLAAYQEKIISGSLCLFGKDTMQAHLNATRTDFLSMSPLKLILDQARKDGSALNMKYLHLGGGKGGVNDSLYVFKSRFSDRRFLFKTWRYIHNKEVYEKLIYNKFDQNLPSTVFFPLYRA